MTVVHVRKRLPRSQSTQWYLDRRDLSAYVLTFCGADVTDQDIAWRDGRTKWAQANACPACIDLHNQTLPGEKAARR